MYLLRMILSTLLISTLVWVGGCVPLIPQEKFDIGFSAPKSDPVYIEKIIYDNSWAMSAGILSLDWKEVGKIIVPAPPYPPVPQKIFIRWFDYKQQVFYETTVDIPREAAKVVASVPKPQFGSRIITTGVLPNGQAVVWVSNSLRDSTGTWIELARAQGSQVEGDVENYRAQTEEMRQLGEI